MNLVQWNSPVIPVQEYTVISTGILGEGTTQELPNLLNSATQENPISVDQLYLDGGPLHSDGFHDFARTVSRNSVGSLQNSTNGKMRKTKTYKTLNYLLLVQSPIQDLKK